MAEGWPTSHLGFAYFCAIGVAWVMSRRGMSTGLRAMIVLGAIGSLFYATQIFLHLDKYMCKYCIACHAANFVLLGITFMGSGFARNSARVVIASAVTFFVSTGALYGIGAWSEQATKKKGEQEMQQTLANLNKKADQDIANAGTPEAPADPKAGTVDPDTGIRTPTVAPPIVKGEIVRGAPELRDRPPAIKVMGYTSGKGFTGHYRIGYEDAPIRIVIFSDYQCNDCKRVEKELFRLLETSKDIMYSHRHFPFCRPCNKYLPRDMHPNACYAAIAAEVAGEMKGPEAFWQFHQWLFGRGGGFTNEDLSKGLMEMGLDPTIFEQRMNHIHNKGGEIMDRIQSDVEEANGLGLHFTPMMFVNGVEVRAFQQAGALTQAVQALRARNLPFGSPENDHPNGAFEKFVADWENSASVGVLGPDRFVAIEGSPDAQVKLEAWIDYASPNSPIIDREIREVMKDHDNVSYIVRHFSTEQACNPRLKSDTYKNSCEMAKAAEAVGRLAGVEAYFKIHDWLLANQAAYSTDALRAFLPTIGVDPDKVVAMFEDPEVIGGVQDDQTFLFTKVSQLTIPHLFVNYKEVPRWQLDGEDVIRAIVERAESGE